MTISFLLVLCVRIHEMTTVRCHFGCGTLNAKRYHGEIGGLRIRSWQQCRFVSGRPVWYGNNQKRGMTMKTKIIKRYQNRKLYDTEESAYVTLDEISKMIKAGETVKVIDNRTKNDITASTFTQLLYESEKKVKHQPSVELLTEIIQKGDGSFSGYIVLMKQDAQPENAGGAAKSVQSAQSLAASINH